MPKKNAELVGETAEVLLTTIKESVQAAHANAQAKGMYLPAEFLKGAAEAFALVVEHDQQVSGGGRVVV